MKKLFKAIRHGDIDEVKAILEKNPEAISSIAAPPPKKDMGQSPLQVAIKVSEYEIAQYLIEQGADVNFMESEEDGSDWRTPVLHDAIRAALMSLCYRDKKGANEGLKITEELLKRGADPNKCASNTFAALDECVSRAEYILDNQGAYPTVQKEAEKMLASLLDILLEHGADFKEWANHGHYAGEGETNRELFLDDFVPVPDKIQELTIRGKTSTTVYKGDIDRTAHTRAVMQAYCKKRDLFGSY